MQDKETKKIVSAPKQKGYIFFALISLGLIILIVVVSFLLLRNTQNTNYVYATIGKDTYKLEVSNTDATRQMGLSERDGLSEKTGMLFDFGENGDWRMIMRQMRFPIDIVWLNVDKKIIYIKDNATPAEYPEVYRAKELSRYVVELPNDAVERQGLKVGDYISF